MCFPRITSPVWIRVSGKTDWEGRVLKWEGGEVRPDQCAFFPRIAVEPQQPSVELYAWCDVAIASRLHAWVEATATLVITVTSSRF